MKRITTSLVVILWIVLIYIGIHIYNITTTPTPPGTIAAQEAAQIAKEQLMKQVTP